MAVSSLFHSQVVERRQKLPRRKTLTLVGEHRREPGRAGLGMDRSIWETTGFTIFTFCGVEAGYWFISA